MIDPTKVNINDIPKQFIDAGLAAHTKEFFYVILGSGNALNGFATSPSQFKALANMMSKNLELFEQKYGIIVQNDKEPIISPIQIERPRQDE